MNTKRYKKITIPYKNIFIVVVILVCIFVALEAMGITHFISSFNNSNINQSKDDKTNIDSKPSTVDSEKNNTSEPTSNDISLSTRREADGSLTVLTQLQNYSDGVCDLTIKNGTKIYTQTAAVMYQTSFSACEGFSVPSNAVPYGTWQITLVVTSKGKVNTKTISVEVK